MCKDHPRYQVKQKPVAPCEPCWRMWIKKQDSRAWVRYAEEQVRRNQDGT